MFYLKITNIEATLSNEDIAALRWLGFYERKYRVQQLIFEACFQRTINSFFRHAVILGAHNFYTHFFNFRCKCLALNFFIYIYIVSKYQ